MSQCPSDTELLDFLEAEPRGTVRTEIHDHIEGCPLCRQALDRLARGDEWPDQTPPLPPTTGPKPIARLKIEFPLPPTAEAPLGQLASFDILAKLGEGSYGVVFKARQRDLDRLVALKVLRPELAGIPKIRRRFEQEARAAAAVKNPYVVIIHDVVAGATNFFQPFIVMEYVEGQPLSTWLKPEGLDRREAVAIVLQVARGLTAAHGRGVVHRDIKPANILVEKHKDGVQVKIADFGIAQGIDELRRNEAPARHGTRGYMSPEATVDFRSDLYSLGATLYQLLTGQLPYGGKQPADTGVPVPPPRTLNRRVDRDLDAITLKCLAWSPEDRYETAAELADHLGRWLRNEPVPVRRHGAWELFRLWCRRKPLAAGLAAALAMVIVGVVSALFAWQRAEFRSERIARLHSADAARDVDEQLHAADFRQPGAFLKVRHYVDDKIQKLPDEPQYREARALLESKLVLACGLADGHERFLLEANDTWFLMGEERAGEARRACERALASFGVLQHDHWWQRPPVSDLTDGQKRQLQREVYRLLLVLATIHLQQGLQPFLTKWKLTNELDEASQASHAILARARAMERFGLVPPARTVAILEKGATTLRTLPKDKIALAVAISKAPKNVKPFVLPESFENEADYFFLGVVHRFLGTHLKDDVTRVVRYMGPSEFDFDNPLSTAERLLRQAAENDPRDYWAWFMLGRVLMESEDYGAAEVAFSSCIALRPDYSRGYEHRGLVLVYRAERTDKPAVRAELLRQAERDSQTAVRLAPHDASTYWVRGDMDRLQGRYRSGVDAYAHALVLDDQLQERISRRNRLQDIKVVVDKVLAEDPSNPEALALRALYGLAQAVKAEAIAKVASEFDTLAKDAPKHPLVCLGHGQALERLAAAADYKELRAPRLHQALDAYHAVPDVAVAGARWRYVEACKGQARVLWRLQRPKEAEQAWHEARRVDPTLPPSMPALQGGS
jgi:cytochrome c-type biogenesis protein CcmH/NrfG/predicted Ser/Thr protein kinase